MGVLLIRCPSTGREFSTGIHVEPETFSRLPQKPGNTRCPHCRSVHFWLPQEAKFMEAIAPADWIENQLSDRQSE